jgi:ectoine hydroxylase-related dioxygenase (phytanoyl-CoA dioxygenase family)
MKHETSQFRAKGYVVVESILSHEVVQSLIHALDQYSLEGKRKGGTRNLLDFAEIRELAQSAAVQSVVTPILGGQAFPVRGILFDKTETSNWLVPWHQDVTIAVIERIDTEDFGPWSVKQGTIHVQPPAVVLEQMLSVRLHLDACPKENGALRVLPATHEDGKLPQSSINASVASIAPVECEVGLGGALLMRPLLLHASSASTLPGHRRVIPLDFAATQLPNGLRCAEAS